MANHARALGKLIFVFIILKGVEWFHTKTGATRSSLIRGSIQHLLCSCMVGEPWEAWLVPVWNWLIR